MATNLGRLSTTHNESNVVSYDAGADLTGKEGYAVKFDGSGDIILAAVDGEEVLGVLLRGATSGSVVDVAIGGRCDVIVDAALGVGAIVQAKNGGKVMAVAATKFIVGRLLKASGADGDVVEMQVNCKGFYPA